MKKGDLLAWSVMCCLAAGCAAVSLPSGFSTPVGSADAQWTLMVDGHQRTYWLHVPREDDGRPLPLVIVLHGHGGTARRIRRTSGMNAQADQAGFAVAYPEGTSWFNIPWRSWNAGTCCGYAVNRRVDDVQFIGAMLDDLQWAHRIDPRRVYVTGMSNGGMMTYRLACELSDRLAAVGVVAGALGVDACRPSRSVPLLMIHGTADDCILYQGGRSPRSGYRRIDKPLAETVALWVTHNRCAPTPRTEQHGAVRLDTYTDCAEGADVVVATILHGRHVWPGARTTRLAETTPTAAWSATPTLWAFFSQHVKPE